jgi:hypothetical protein
MDNDTFNLLSQVIVRGRAQAGAIHPGKLVSDRVYAEEVFLKLEQSDDEGLVLLSLQLRQKLGHLEQAATTPDDGGGKPPKYLYGARG